MKYLAVLLVIIMSCTPVRAEEKPLFTIELTEEWGKIKVNDEILDNDFEIEFEGVKYIVETMKYSTTHSIEICKVEVYEDEFIFIWELKPNAHEEFKTATIYNKTHNEKTHFDVTHKGSVKVPILDGKNDYDLYAYTGQTVGIVEFDLFDPIKIEVVK